VREAIFGRRVSDADVVMSKLGCIGIENNRFQFREQKGATTTFIEGV
jgi:hypothetical protein